VTLGSAACLQESVNRTNREAIMVLLCNHVSPTMIIACAILGYPQMDADDCCFPQKKSFIVGCYCLKYN
jgi:hypothetical protein